MPRKKEGKKKGKKLRNPEALGVAGFTLGIVSLSTIFFGLFFYDFILGPIASIVGLIFCIVQNKRVKTKIAKKGMIINIIALTLHVTFITLIIVFYPQINAALQSALH